MKKNLFNIIKNIYIKISSRKDPRFLISRAEQEKILHSFPEPIDNIERSYFQFLCQNKMIGGPIRVLYHIGSIFALIMVWVQFSRNTNKHEYELKNNKHYDLVCLYEGITKDRIPKELLKSYASVMFIDGGFRHQLTNSDKKWILKTIKRYPFSWMFLLKVVNRISYYSFVIQKYSPNAIAAIEEYSCCSSLLTDYCHYHKVKHINFMHGEKIFYIRDSFFRFDKCYVWDAHYIKLFTELRAYPKQFEISLPPLFYEVIKSSISQYDYCYYLAGEKSEQLEKIFGILSKMQNFGYAIIVRPHPRWTDLQKVQKLSLKYDIPIEKEGTDILQSIGSTRSVISLFSTVLFQAHIYNKILVIDDLTDKERFNILKQADYIGFNFKHIKLSKINHDINLSGKF